LLKINNGSGALPLREGLYYVFSADVYFVGELGEVRRRYLVSDAEKGQDEFLEFFGFRCWFSPRNQYNPRCIEGPCEVILGNKIYSSCSRSRL